MNPQIIEVFLRRIFLLNLWTIVFNTSHNNQVPRNPGIQKPWNEVSENTVPQQPPLPTGLLNLAAASIPHRRAWKAKQPQKLAEELMFRKQQKLLGYFLIWGFHCFLFWGFFFGVLVLWFWGVFCLFICLLLSKICNFHVSWGQVGNCPCHSLVPLCWKHMKSSGMAHLVFLLVGTSNFAALWTGSVSSRAL